MKNLILIPLLLVLLVCPVLGQSVTYYAPADKAVWQVDIDMPAGTSGTITLTLLDGSTVGGTFAYSAGYPQTMSTTLGSDSSSYTYYIPIPGEMSMSVWNGDNSSLYRDIKMGYGQNRGIWNDVLISQISRSPTVSYVINADQEITVTNNIIDRITAEKQLAVSEDDSLISQLQEPFSTSIGIFSSAMFWIKFLFYDNLILTVCLYLTGSMAYAANTSRDIFQFYKTWFGQQTAMFRFIVQIVSLAVSIVAQIGGLAIAGASSILSKLFSLI